MTQNLRNDTPVLGNRVRLIRDVSVAVSRRYVVGSCGTCLGGGERGWNRFMGLVTVQMDADPPGIVVHLSTEKLRVIE
jgi:hypothetical protein